MEKVQSLKQQLADTQTELASLQQAYSLGEKRLVRASKLISALGDEAGRWGNSADSLAKRLQLLIGQIGLVICMFRTDLRCYSTCHFAPSACDIFWVCHMHVQQQQADVTAHGLPPYTICVSHLLGLS